MPIARLIRLLFQSCRIIGALAVVIVRCCPVQAAEPPSPGCKVLVDKYISIKAELAKNLFGIPLYLISNKDSRYQRADLYGIFDYPFTNLKDALRAPGDWCDITSLHLNIKACTRRRIDDRRLLTLYAGRKYYQPPEDAYELDFNFHVASEEPDYLDITLSAGKGPLFTEDYLIRVEAAPIDANRSFVHFSYSYRYGLLASMAVKSYFATMEHDKTGFSTVGTDRKGNPVYVGGLRGILERNAVRYYFALQAYMDTLKYPGNERFEKRIGRWYDLTERYPQQLYEMSRDEYLAAKRREHDNQIKLQKKSPEKNGYMNITSPHPK